MQRSGAFRGSSRTVPRIQSEAQSTAAKWFGVTVAVCACVLSVAVTVRLVIALFN